jgi:hypothetical protein
MKDGVIWDVTPRGSCVPPKRRFLQEPHGVTSYTMKVVIIKITPFPISNEKGSKK